AFGVSNQQLLLPSTVVKKLIKQNERLQEQNAFQSEIEETIKHLLYEGDFTLEQLHTDFIAFTKQPKKSPSTGFNLKCIDDKYLQIFDTFTINNRKRDSAYTRNVQAVMKRFKDDDDGQRILRKVPLNFLNDIQKIKIHYPNCLNFLMYVESFAMLALKQPFPAFYFPPVLLMGPPGVGKTAVVNAVADIIGIASRQVDLASSTAGFILSGMSTNWSDAKTGVIIDLLRDNEAANPIVILDEIDKASAEAKFNPLGPLHSLLEQRTAAKFIDEALDLPADASHVLYVATANSIEHVPKAILSRFIVIQIDALKHEQHAYVTQSIYALLLQRHDCKGLFIQKLCPEVIEALRNYAPRTIKSILTRSLAQAAMRDPKSKKLTITQSDLLFFNLKTSNNSSDYNRNHSFGFLQ
ncbi:MAG: AAA family ATPase, partial [Methylococcales bacterium]|nr:AAA family ATPase [Methylococcales bacterium]